MENKKYLLGLDLGTNSVGFCLCDENSKIIKKNGKYLWGVRLFEEAHSAADRRGFRASRRRLIRRNQRIKWLQELMGNEIIKQDPNFFRRLAFSQIHKDDENNLNLIDFDYAQTLFNGKLYDGSFFNDKVYYDKYPTIYHLRKALVEYKDTKFDIRLVYLAIAHILKHRGNFLYDNLQIKGTSMNDDEEQLKITVNQICDIIDFGLPNDKLFDIFKNLKDKKGYKQKYNYLKEEILDFNYEIKLKNSDDNDDNFIDKVKNVYFNLLSGSNKIKFKNFIENGDNEIDEEILKKTLSFDSETFDLDLEELNKYLNDNQSFELIKKFKIIYDNVLLVKFLNKSKFICVAMVKKYEEHEQQLKDFKKYIKEYHADKYYEIFRKVDAKLNNYPKYIGSNNTKNKKERFSKCKLDDFYKYVKTTLDIKESSKNSTPYLNKIATLMEEKNFLVKQRTNNNSIFPVQLAKAELEIILDNQSKFYPFLNEQDKFGSIKGKIIKIITYKIPYYVGPLISYKGEKHDEIFNQFGWAKYKQNNVKVTPWNFDDVVDKQESQSKFIEKLISNCAYLPTEQCLPKISPLIEYVNVLNEINKMKVNGKFLNTEEKNDLLKNVYLNNKKVKTNDIKDYFKSKTNLDEIELNFANSDKTFDVKHSLTSYVKFKDILELTDKDDDNYINGRYVDVKNNLTTLDILEEIAWAISVYEDKTGLEGFLTKNKDRLHLDESKIKSIKGITSTGYSRLSRKLLTGIKENIFIDNNGVVYESSIIQSLIFSNYNLTELVAKEDLPYKVAIQKYNEEHMDDEKISKSDPEFIRKYVDKLYVSPGMKRPLIQAYKISKELEKIVNHPIDEFYIECTRSNKVDKKESKSRKQKIIDLYKDAKITTEDLNNELINTDEGYFRSDFIYLYFTQMGKDIYTGEKIDLDELKSNSHNYDIDHIYPQSKIKDDSLNNRVLTSKQINEKKSDKYPIPYGDFRINKDEVYRFQKVLHDKELISDEKFNRLTSHNELSDDQIYNFVNRQIIYTSQSVKALKDVLETFNNDDHKVKVVMSKAENISDFRHEFDIVKSREANNLHHAHDAFLNVVVGRTINEYFEPILFNIKKHNFDYKKTTNVLKIFKDYDQNKNPGKHKENILDKDGNLVWSYNKNSILKNKMSLEYINQQIFNNFNMLITTRTYKSNAMFSKIGLKAAKNLKDNDTALSIKNYVKTNKPLLSDYKKYGGYSDLSFNYFMIINGKQKAKEIYALVSYPALFEGNKEKIDEYIKKSYKIDDYKIEIDKLNINTVFEINKSRFCVTGKTNDNFSIKNLKETYFNKDLIKIIRKVTKFNEFLTIKKAIIKDEISEQFMDKYKNLFINNGNEFILSDSKSKNGSKIIISKNELMKLYDEIISRLNSIDFKSNQLNNLVNIGKKMLENRNLANSLDIIQLSLLLKECLKLIQTNRELTNLTYINGPKKAGGITLNYKFKESDDIKVVYQSVTGYYSKVVWRLSK